MSASAVLKLQKAGFSTEQVEALADFMDTQVVGKADLDAAVYKLETSIAGIRSEIGGFEAGTKNEFASVRSDTKAEFSSIRSEMKLLEQRMTIKLGAMLAAFAGLLIAAMRYLPPAGH